MHVSLIFFFFSFSLHSFDISVFEIKNSCEGLLLHGLNIIFYFVRHIFSNSADSQNPNNNNVQNSKWIKKKSDFFVQKLLTSDLLSYWFSLIQVWAILAIFFFFFSETKWEHPCLCIQEHCVGEMTLVLSSSSWLITVGFHQEFLGIFFHLSFLQLSEVCQYHTLKNKPMLWSSHLQTLLLVLCIWMCGTTCPYMVRMNTGQLNALLIVFFETVVPAASPSFWSSPWVGPGSKKTFDNNFSPLSENLRGAPGHVRFMVKLCLFLLPWTTHLSNSGGVWYSALPEGARLSNYWIMSDGVFQVFINYFVVYVPERNSWECICWVLFFNFNFILWNLILANLIGFAAAHTHIPK